jgi:hypothetical protein
LEANMHGTAHTSTSIDCKHTVDLENYGVQAEILLLRRAGGKPAACEISVDGCHARVRLQQVVAQTRDSSRDHPFNDRLNAALDARQEPPDVDGLNREDLDVLLERVGEWAAWSFSLERIAEPSPRF